MARPVTMDDILMVVANHFQIGKDLIKGKDKSKTITTARHIVIYLVTRMTDLDYVEIGKLFGGRPRRCIISYIETVQDMNLDKEKEILMLKLVGDIRVMAELEDPTPKPTMEALEDTIERLVQLYTKLQLEKEENEQRQAENGSPVDPAVSGLGTTG